VSEPGFTASCPPSRRRRSTTWTRSWKVAGVDLVFVTPNDLSGALGVTGQMNHPELLAAIEKIETAAKRHDVALGGLGLNAQRTNALIERGYRFIVITSEVGLLQSAVGNLLKEVKRK
jgi:2-keto-3-deoxy-L-rhamnonate aldolase RhmA